MNRRFTTAAVLEMCEIAAWGECAACTTNREDRWLRQDERWKRPAPIQVRAFLAFMAYITRKKCESPQFFEEHTPAALAGALQKYLRYALPSLTPDLEDRVDEALGALLPLTENSGSWTEDIKVLRDQIGHHVGLDLFADLLDL
jgi:hypothetical protein